MMPGVNRLAGIRVLVAEDVELNRVVLEEYLRGEGAAVEFVVDGRHAVESVERDGGTSFDVVLMDIQMPELDGVEAARRIVAARGANGLPRIIAMTANAMPGDRESYVAAGMDGYLAKPVELDSLAATLTQAAHLVRHADVAEAADAALDLERLEHLRGLQDDSQPTLVRELIDMFLAESPQQVQRIHEAHEREDATALRNLAHRLLSATQNIGATRLSLLCAEIERLARADRLGAATALLGPLHAERERAASALALVRMRY